MRSCPLLAARRTRAPDPRSQSACCAADRRARWPSTAWLDPARVHGRSCPCVPARDVAQRVAQSVAQCQSRVSLGNKDATASARQRERPRCLRGLSLCAEEDSNLHPVIPDQALNLARLPIPPSARGDGEYSPRRGGLSPSAGADTLCEHTFDPLRRPRSAWTLGRILRSATRRSSTSSSAI